MIPQPSSTNKFRAKSGDQSYTQKVSTPPKTHVSVTGLAIDKMYGRSLTDDSVTVDFSLHLGSLLFLLIRSPEGSALHFVLVL